MRALLCSALLVAATLAGAAPAGDYRAGIEEWRARRERSLRADDGWLTVVGLHWLKPGENRFEELDGLTFLLTDGRVRVRIRPASPALVNGKRVAEAELKPDSPGPPDRITAGSKTLFVIERGGRFAVRVRDTESPYRREFRGLSWYPVNPAMRIEARWIPYDTPRTRSIATIVNVDEKMVAPGVAEFRLGSQTHRLEPVNSDGQLFFIFKDRSAGKGTYPAGRFLYADPPRDGKVVLDFNKAYSPPCAFTPYATCPLPSRANHLSVAIEAGEKYHAADH